MTWPAEITPGDTIPLACKVGQLSPVPDGRRFFVVPAPRALNLRPRRLDRASGRRPEGGRSSHRAIAPLRVVPVRTIACPAHHSRGIYLGWPVKLEWSSSDPSSRRSTSMGSEVRARGRVELTAPANGIALNARPASSHRGGRGRPPGPATFARATSPAPRPALGRGPRVSCCPPSRSVPIEKPGRRRRPGADRARPRFPAESAPRCRVRDSSATRADDPRRAPRAARGVYAARGICARPSRPAERVCCDAATRPTPSAALMESGADRLRSCRSRPRSTAVVERGSVSRSAASLALSRGRGVPLRSPSVSDRRCSRSCCLVAEEVFFVDRGIDDRIRRRILTPARPVAARAAVRTGVALPPRPRRAMTPSLRSR